MVWNGAKFHWVAPPGLDKFRELRTTFRAIKNLESFASTTNLNRTLRAHTLPAAPSAKLFNEILTSL